MDFKSSKLLTDLATRTELLMAAVESLTKALDSSENRIRQLEDALRAIETQRHNGKHGNRQRTAYQAN